MELVDFLRARLLERKLAAEAALRYETGLSQSLRDNAKTVQELYGSPEPPEDDMRPADRLWFAVQDAADWIDQNGPARVLAEAEEKREILDWYERRLAIDSRGEDADDYENVTGSTLRSVVQSFVGIYRDHPDFDPAWLED